jgi:hypothetical protein
MKPPSLAGTKWRHCALRGRSGDARRRSASKRRLRAGGGDCDAHAHARPSSTLPSTGARSGSPRAGRARRTATQRDRSVLPIGEVVPHLQAAPARRAAAHTLHLREVVASPHHLAVLALRCGDRGLLPTPASSAPVAHGGSASTDRTRSLGLGGCRRDRPGHARPHSQTILDYVPAPSDFKFAAFWGATRRRPGWCRPGTRVRRRRGGIVPNFRSSWTETAATSSCSARTPTASRWVRCDAARAHARASGSRRDLGRVLGAGGARTGYFTRK